MLYRESSFAGVRDLALYRRSWLPDGPVRAVMIVVHGLGEHSGRYALLAAELASNGIAVHAFDLPGHGNSPGEREVPDSFDDYTISLDRLRGVVSNEQPGVPLFMLGHSMGGLVVADYLREHQSGLRGAILSAPAIARPRNVKPIVVTVGKLLARLFPRMGITGLELEALSRDPAVVDAYIADPLVFHGRTPARLASEIIRVMDVVSANLSRIQLPILVLQGTADRIIDPVGASSLAEKCGSRDVTLKRYEGFYHELFNEPERAQVIGDLLAWLAARTPAVAEPSDMH
ncbi:MAG: alpha/beta hydrolase [Chloroflexi bacterium]|nr:alpha/beta hydrolase [Chloroflexota bacterium]